MDIMAGLGGSKLEARGGIVGGNIELNHLHASRELTLGLRL